MSNEIQLTIGLNDKDSKRQEISTEEAQNKLENMVLKYTDGASFSAPARGLFKHEDGQAVRETSITITLFEIKKELAQKLAQEMAQVFNQESIVYKVSEVKELDFIGA